MSDRSRVVWSEGMFLRPQHFQQAQRQQEFALRQLAICAEGHFWGFHSLALDTASLAIGKVAIANASGVMPDGTPFAFPGVNDAPSVLNISETVKAKRIML